MKISEEQRKERNDKNIRILKDLGFKPIKDKDSEVRIDSPFMDCLIVDFSAIDPECFVSHAIQKAYDEGFNHGVHDTRKKLKSIIFGVEEEGEY